MPARIALGSQIMLHFDILFNKISVKLYLWSVVACEILGRIRLFFRVFQSIFTLKTRHGPLCA